MSAPSRPVADPLREDDAYLEAVRRAVRAAVLDHARAGRAVPTWRDGKVVWIPPEEILSQLGSDPFRRSDI
jgi:hypothetical protein